MKSIHFSWGFFHQIILMGCFFLLPIVFFPVFGINGLPFGYERYKVLLLILIALGIGVNFLFRKSVLEHRKKIFLAVIVLVIFSSLWRFFGGISFVVFLLGTEEKRHGMLFFTSLIAIYWILKKYQSIELNRKIETISLWSGMVVCIYALCQFIGLDFVPVQYVQMPWGIGRVFSTLGNPNYLAGYLLLLFPILTRRTFAQTWGYWLLFISTLILTGSVTGVVVLVIYLIVLLLKKPAFSKIGKIALCIFLMSGGVIGYFSLGQKTLSLESRFSLWQSWGQVQKNDPIGLLIGHGPDSILPTFSKGDIPLDSRYFQIGSRLDSFHNIILDFIFFFGIMGFLPMAYFLIARWKKMPKISKEASILFFVFFSVNIAISVHFLIFLYYLSFEEKTHKIT